jgi:hypothetical protein
LDIVLYCHVHGDRKQNMVVIAPTVLSDANSGLQKIPKLRYQDSGVDDFEQQFRVYSS